MPNKRAPAKSVSISKHVSPFSVVRLALHACDFVSANLPTPTGFSTIFHAYAAVGDGRDQLDEKDNGGASEHARRGCA